MTREEQEYRRNCDGSCDIALARRQVGNRGVPGNAKECAHMWEAEASDQYRRALAAEAEVERLSRRGEAARLREALRAIVAICQRMDSLEGDFRSKRWAQDDLLPAVCAALSEAAPAAAEGPSERFERLAEKFHRDTGLLAPGKDAPPGLYTEKQDENRRQAWEFWLAAAAEGEGTRCAKCNGRGWIRDAEHGRNTVGCPACESTGRADAPPAQPPPGPYSPVTLSEGDLAIRDHDNYHRGLREGREREREEIVKLIASWSQRLRREGQDVAAEEAAAIARALASPGTGEGAPSPDTSKGG